MDSTSRSRFFVVTAKGALKPQADLAEALAQRGRGGYLWIDLVNPARADLEALVEPFEFHPLSVEDCLDDDQVPKFDEFSHNTFLLVNRFQYRDGALRVDEVDIAIGADFLISVNSARPGDDGYFARLDEAIRLDGDSARKGPDFLLHLMLDFIVDDKSHALEALQEEIDGAEETILNARDQFNPASLLHLRRSLLSVRKSLFHEREILVKICRRDSPHIGEKAIFHFRDIYDHLAKFFELTEIYREIITSLMEMYLSMVNNQMAQSANRTNQVVRRLTLITTIFMPLTLLAGVGGMSEWSMMTGPENWRVSYPAFLVAMGVMGVANFYVLKWIEARAGRKEG
jgi:magnesium transporter